MSDWVSDLSGTGQENVSGPTPVFSCFLFPFQLWPSPWPKGAGGHGGSGVGPGGAGQGGGGRKQGMEGEAATQECQRANHHMYTTNKNYW